MEYPDRALTIYFAHFGPEHPHVTSLRRNLDSFFEASDDNENPRASERAGREKKCMIL